MATILVVEDDADNREALGRRLTWRGHEVMLAVDGLDALDQAQANRPDLVLMDMNMPRLDGWGATRRFRADSTLADLPIIALTGYNSDTERVRALDSGCNDHHGKPIEFDILLAQIDALLSPRPGPTA